LKLPNADRATVPERKLREYLLSATHPEGKFKAAFFASIGYPPDRWESLRDDLLALANEGEATPAGSNRWGSKYTVDGKLGPDAAAIRTVWFVPVAEGRPRLTTAYPR
jgi:hypothetical protein